jgi:lysophospholipase L1-like esterase
MSKFDGLAVLHKRQPDSKLSAVALLDIRLDGGTQAREEIHPDTVSDYAQVLRQGKTLPAVVVFYDGAVYWLADGFHRYFAHRELGLERVEADIRQGTQRDAVLYAAGANDTHGLRRSNADKRRAVKMILADPEWAGWSNVEISKRCAVDDKTVASVREELAQGVGSGIPRIRKAIRAGKTYEIKTRPKKRPTTSKLNVTLSSLNRLLDRAPQSELEKYRQQLTLLRDTLNSKLT